MVDKKKQGKQNRAAGARFELKVRKDLEQDGWIVSKWMNTVEDGKIIPAKRKYNPFKKVLSIGTGFPDFIAFRPWTNKVYGVEVKSSGYLDREEKEKFHVYNQKGIFVKIFVAKKGEQRGSIIYEEVY